MITSFRMFRSFALAFGLAFVLSPLALGQDNNKSTASRARTVSSGEKMKIKGVVVKRDADTFTVRDLTGNDTIVRLTDKTSVKANGGFLRSGTNYGTTNILRGLNLEVEGRGGSSGELVADKVRFNETDLRTARTVETRANPLEERASAAEGRLSEVEQNAQKLSGQLDELAAVSNAARDVGIHGVLSGFRSPARGIRNRRKFIELAGELLSVLLDFAETAFRRASSFFKWVSARFHGPSGAQIRFAEPHSVGNQLTTGTAASFDLKIQTAQNIG